MVRPQRHYRVWPRAYRNWEKIDWIPFLLTDVVDAIEALPESELTVTRSIRPPVVFQKVRATVFGFRFEIQGVRTVDGRWLEVMAVRPMGDEVK